MNYINKSVSGKPRDPFQPEQKVTHVGPNPPDTLILPILALTRREYATSETYFGEKTVHINKWFLISSSMMVYATKSTEFNPNGTRHGKPIIIFRS